MPHKQKYIQYWRKNLQYLAVLLGIWFIVSCGFGILLVEELDKIRIGVLGMLFNFGVAILVHRFTPRPPHAVVERVERIRYPRGAGKAHEISVQNVNTGRTGASPGIFSIRPGKGITARRGTGLNEPVKQRTKYVVSKSANLPARPGV